jgi:hypothetical protein
VWGGEVVGNQETNMSMIGYVKLFQSILGSTIWASEDWMLRVWIAILVLKDRNHVVRMSVVGLANIARVTVEQCKEALQKFQEPEKDSTSQEYEGRRIEALAAGGWKVLNGEKYRMMLSLEERREYNRSKQAEYRKRKKEVTEEGARDGAQQAIVEGLKEYQMRGYIPGELEE